MRNQNTRNKNKPVVKKSPIAMMQQMPHPSPDPCRVTVQDSIPIYAIHDKYNLIETYPGLYTRSYYLGENNYQTETEDVENVILTKYRSMLNAFGINCEMSVTIFNKNINMTQFRENVLKKETGDNLDYLRNEMNHLLEQRLQEGKNNIEKKKYITVGIHEKSASRAYREFTDRIDRELDTNLKKAQSGAKIIPLEQRLEIIHDTYNMGDQGNFLINTKVQDANGKMEKVKSFDINNMRKMGCTVNDIVGPSSMQFNNDYMMFGSKYARAFIISDYPSVLTDEFFVNLTNMDFNLIATVNIQPVPPQTAKNIVMFNYNAAQAVRTDERQALMRQNLPEDMISPNTEKAVEKAKELMDDMSENDEKLFKTTCTVVIWADSEENLENNTKALEDNCRGMSVDINIMKLQQEMGFNSTLPLLDNEIPENRRRTLKSTSIATIACPFSNLELMEPAGINYSMNLNTHNLIIYDRLAQPNYNGFILGVTGAGKSFTAKLEMLSVILGSDSDVVVIDPEEEYGGLAKLLHGEYIKLTPGGSAHINPLEISSGYTWSSSDDNAADETNPILAKSDTTINLLNTMINKPFGLDSVQETIIDECVHALYDPFVENDTLQPIAPDQMPTLTDLQKLFSQRTEPEARELSMALKLYTGNGSLNIFGDETNINMNNRFILFNIRDVGEKLKPISMLIILDFIQNKLIANRNRGRNTWFWIDECHLLLKDDRTAEFLAALWKRARKYGGVPTGITQNVSDIIDNPVAQGLLKNCNFVQMLNQDTSDRNKLAELLQLSDSMCSALTNAPKGQGVIYTGSCNIPFYSKFPATNDDGTPNVIYKAITSSLADIKKYKAMDEAEKFTKEKAGKRERTIKQMFE